MAKTDVDTRFVRIYGRVLDLTEEWRSLQVSASLAFGSAINGIARLKLLEDQGNFDELNGLPNLKGAMLSKQLLLLEKKMSSLRQTLCEFESLCHQLEKQVKAGENVVREMKISPQALKAKRSGPYSSLQERIDGLKEIKVMHADELRTKKSTLKQITHEISEQDASALHDLFNVEVHIRPQRIEDLVNIVFLHKKPERL